MKALGAEHEDHKVNRFPLSVAALLLAAVLLATWAPLTAQGTATAPSGGDGTFYIGTYTDRIQVLEERTRTVIAQIQLQNGNPGRFVVSADRERLYVSDATMLHIETIDLAERRSIDTFTLSEGDELFRIRGFAVDPQETYALILGKTRIKHVDRFEIGPSIIIRYDLRRARGHGHDPVARWP